MSRSACHLVPIDADNRQRCAGLVLPPDQARHLASNMATIAESAFNPHF